MATAARRTDWSSPLPRRTDRATDTPPTAPLHEPELPFPASEQVPDMPPEALDAVAPTGWSRWRWSNLRRGLPTLRRRWLAVAGLAVVVFGIAIGVIAVIGASTNQPLAAPLAPSHHAPENPSPAPKSTPSSTPTPEASSTTAPSPAVTPSASASESASPGPGATESPSVSPAPSPSPSVGVTPSPGPAAATAP